MCKNDKCWRVEALCDRIKKLESRMQATDEALQENNDLDDLNTKLQAEIDGVKNSHEHLKDRFRNVVSERDRADSDNKHFREEVRLLQEEVANLTGINPSIFAPGEVPEILAAAEHAIENSPMTGEKIVSAIQYVADASSQGRTLVEEIWALRADLAAEETRSHNFSVGYANERAKNNAAKVELEK